jgi:hypothetical protein
MSNTYTQTMFDSIKSALTNASQSSTNVRADILRFTPDNQYDLRLLPNVENPGETFFHYYNQAWTSFSTGQYISALSPQTFGGKCPIATTKFKLKNTGTEEERQKADTIRRAENWLVNVYVINDPSTPENNGTVKIMRFGKQLHKIIMDSIQDDDESSVGFRAFDLTSNGCTFRVKVDRQGEFPSYVTSKFLLPAAVPKVSEDDIEEILKQVYDLKEVFTLKSDDELEKMLDEHFYCGSNEPAKKDPELDEEVPMSFSKEPATQSTEQSSTTSSSPAEDNDEVMEKLLAGLDD